MDVPTFGLNIKALLLRKVAREESSARSTDAAGSSSSGWRSPFPLFTTGTFAIGGYPEEDLERHTLFLGYTAALGMSNFRGEQAVQWTPDGKTLHYPM